MKWRKSLSALLSACLLLSCTSCSFVENYFGVTQEEKQLQQQEESRASALSSALEPGNIKKLGETITYNHLDAWPDEGPTYSKLEITVTGAQLFDSFADSGIPAEETYPGFLNEMLDTDEYTIPETPFVLVDVTIKKVESNSKQDGPYSNGILCTIFGLYNRQQLEWCKENDQEPMSQDPYYFSGHGEGFSDDQGYEFFWLDVGEEQNYQFGFFLRDPAKPLGRESFAETYVYSADGGLLMGIIDNTPLYYVDLDIGN